MASKFKKSTSYFDKAAEAAEERQQKIVESASPKRALKGHLRGLYSCLSTFPRAIASD